MKVRFSLTAQAEARSAIAYIAGQNPSAARRVRESLVRAVATLADTPFRGRRVGSGHMRRLVSGRYLVARIIHGSRKLAAALSE